MEIPPKERISEVVREIKKESSKELKRRFKYIRQIYKEGGMWSVGYFVSSIGLNEMQIRKYIEKQNNYDRGLDVTEEFS